MVANTFLSFSRMPWSSHSCNDRGYSYFTRIFAIDVLTALKSSVKKHRRKRILRLLRLYGGQALQLKFTEDGLRYFL